MTENGRPPGRLYEGHTRTALDGSRVTDFLGPGDKVYQRFEKDGRTWWQWPDRLCGLRDIDAARRASQEAPRA